MTTTRVYAADILKMEKTDEGDLLVYGKATGPDLDLDQQICDPDWLKTAMPKWARWANVREQHSAIAAGVGLETTNDGDDWFLKSLVVDTGTARKVEKGVLKGYSIGIRGARVVKDAGAPGGRIVGGEIVEISLVDRPCNPTATMAVCKSEGGAMAPVDAAGEVLMDLTKAVVVDAPGEADAAQKAAAADSARADAVQTVKAVNGGTRAPMPGLLVKGYDESADIAGGFAAVAQIAGLIQSEAASLATGRLDEAWDIRLLLDAVCALECFLGREQRQQDAPGGDAVDADVMYIGLSAVRDMLTAGTDGGKAREALEKALTTLAANRQDGGTGGGTVGDGADSNKSATVSDVRTPESGDVTLVKALAASEERNRALEADLAKAKAQPAAGGPAVMRVAPAPTAPISETAKSAAYYLRMADQQTGKARDGYLQLARTAEDAEKRARP
jgi:hypothetical protein